jgi:hypothetical protein
MSSGSDMDEVNDSFEELLDSESYFVSNPVIIEAYSVCNLTFLSVIFVFRYLIASSDICYLYLTFK